MINVYTLRRMVSFAVAAGLAVALAFPINIDAKQAPAQAGCRVTGHATSGQQPLPGVAISIKSGTSVKAATSTDQDGSYAITLTPGQYTITAELTGFGSVEQMITVAADGTCAQTLNIPMTLAPRQPLPTPAPMPAQAGPTAQGQQAAATAPTTSRTESSSSPRLFICRSSSRRTHTAAGSRCCARRPSSSRRYSCIVSASGASAG